jgi:hypothetical protein
MELAVVARVIRQQWQQGVEQIHDVVEGRRLQLAVAMQLLIEGRYKSHL